MTNQPAEIYILAIPITLSRLGDMFSSLVYLSFVGHFITDSMDSASFATASVSFITVIGIGFFSPTLFKLAASTDLNKNNIKSEITISNRLAVFTGSTIALLILFIHTSSLSTITSLITTKDTEALLLTSLSIPAIYLQVTIFNFFNAMHKPIYEVIYIWTFNILLASACMLFIIDTKDRSLNTFLLTYSALRCTCAALAFIYFNTKTSLYIKQLKVSVQPSKEDYLKYTIQGLPMALCLGGESFLFFALSLISKNLGASSLSAYQASLHIASIIYMISIGIGNATGIIAARHFANTNIATLRKTYCRGIKSGVVVLTPILLATFIWRENIAMLYTSDTSTKKLIETNLAYSIPFLAFEFVYIVTRTTLRSVGDFWIPTILTISVLNFFGITLCIAILSINHAVHSIFMTLAICSFILMLTLCWRLLLILRELHQQPMKKS